MALYPTKHTLTQGSLHYRLATLGYQKRKAMGFVSLMKNALFASPLPFEKMKLKKRNTDGVVPPRYVLTQGSSLCSPTLGYQKRNPYGVRLSS